MRLLPRNAAADKAPKPEKALDRPEVLRRYEITVEREFVSLRSQSGQSCAMYCASCAHEVNMLPPEIAADAAGTTTRTIYRWVEEKRVHFFEPSSGKLLICSESLRQLSRSNQLSSGESL